MLVADGPPCETIYRADSFGTVRLSLRRRELAASRTAPFVHGFKDRKRMRGVNYPELFVPAQSSLFCSYSERHERLKRRQNMFMKWGLTCLSFYFGYQSAKSRLQGIR